MTDWIIFARWNALPLDNSEFADKYYQNEFKKIIGTSFTCFDAIVDGASNRYNPKAEANELFSISLSKLEEENFFESHLERYELSAQNIRDFLKESSLIDFPKLSFTELYDLFKESVKLNSVVNAYTNVFYFIGMCFGKELKNYLSEELKDEKKANEYFIALQKPIKDTILTKEKNALKKILEKALFGNPELQNKESSYDFLFSLPNIQQDLEKHREEFSWIPTLTGAPPWTKRDFVNEMIELLKTPKKAEHETIEIDLELPEKIKKIINFLKIAAYIKDDVEALYSYKNFTFRRKFLEELSKRFFIDINSLRLFTQDELLSLLKEQKIDESILNLRKKFWTLYADGSSLHIITGKAALILKNSIIKEEEIDFSISELKGLTGSVGKISGRVKILMRVEDLDIVQKGDVLVSLNTMVDFVPAMKRASAIITEIGGITSHAAIVSREFGIPCITDVKNATKILKNNDLIEVDANNGVIRILKKAK